MDHSFVITKMTKWIYPVTVSPGSIADQYVVTKLGKHVLELQVCQKICFIASLQKYEVPNENCSGKFFSTFAE